LATNIPGTIEFMDGISLADHDPDDILIGRNGLARLVNGKGQVTFNVSELPSVKYNVKAAFYPRWGLKDEESKLSGVDENLEHKHSISLTGSGELAESDNQRNEGQACVMENITIGSEWDPDFWKNRFGQWNEFPVTTKNSDIISNYYFESLDMTIIVNSFKNEITTWRMGGDGL